MKTNLPPNKSTNYSALLVLFVFGVIIIFARNPDPIINPIIYAEDGLWTGIGLTKGWLVAVREARSDYFVTVSIVMLFLSTKLSQLITNNPLDFLPESIAFFSFSFFSAIATGAYAVTKNIIPITFRCLLYFLLLIMPLGGTQNEILGRILQIGFYMPFATFLLLIHRESQQSKFTRYLIDFSILLCSATNPMTFALLAIYFIFNYLKKNDTTSWLKKNIFLLLSNFLLSLFIIPRLGGGNGIPGDFSSSNLIEAIIARPLLYPFVFPWYSELSSIISIIFFLIWIFFTLNLFIKSNNKFLIEIIIISGAFLFIYDLSTILMRPGLTSALNQYKTTSPDRYFMGLNVFFVFITVAAISQMTTIKKVTYNVLGYILLILMSIIYLWQTPNIFELKTSKLPLKGIFNFSEQICLSESPLQGKLLYPDSKTAANKKWFEPTPSDSIIQTYPQHWKMVVPSKLIDKSKCKFFSPDDVGIAGVYDSYNLRPSAPLSIESSIKLHMSRRHINEPISLDRIGVMFGTYSSINVGNAELHLKGPNGTEFTQYFPLEKLIDNSYNYFSTNSKIYTSGEITSSTTGGVSTYESHNENGKIDTCLVFEYSNRTRRFTPGCPHF